MTFELAAHNWMRPEPLEVTLQRLSRLGYSGIEIMAEPARYDPREVRPLLDRHGIRCWGGVSINYGHATVPSAGRAPGPVRSSGTRFDGWRHGWIVALWPT